MDKRWDCCTCYEYIWRFPGQNSPSNLGGEYVKKVFLVLIIAVTIALLVCACSAQAPSSTPTALPEETAQGNNLSFINLLIHTDIVFGDIMATMGVWTYVILFVIIFIETGIIIMPFLPGDSLLFVVGALYAAGANLRSTAASPALGPDFIWIAIGVMFAAAVLGDTVNYHIGKAIGHTLFKKEKARLFNKKNLLKAHAFYEKHGGKTIILARFIPVIRDFAPFVAGMGVMRYGKFITYNVLGGAAWVALGTTVGYFFGNIPFIKQNFSLVIIAIVLISCIPMIVSFTNNKIKARKLRKMSETIK
jgi:membrane-associated protein